LWADSLSSKRWAPGAPALAAAARAVDAVVFHGQSADAALAAQEGRADRAAVRAIALGTLRWYLRLVPAVETLLARPSGVPSRVRALLATAAHQIEYSRNAPEATVHASVDAARLLDAPRSSGLVNAILRRFVAERGTLFAQVDASLAARTAHPKWLTERITADWGDEAVAVLEADNAHPPMTLRIDLTRTNAVEYLSQLSAASIDAHSIQWCPSAITLTRPTSVRELPGFTEGVVSVQDAGAQLAAGLLAPCPGMRVLDACAAPGGKTAHLLETLELLGGDAEVTALDIDASRVALIGDNLRRLRRHAHLAVGDARDPASFWDGRLYERILVDAPCSSTGVIRRHPDIKLLRRATDVAPFAATQLAILRSIVGLLAPRGRLLYSTCSVLPEENEQVVAALLAAERGLTVAAIPPAALPPGALERGAGVQLLPGAEASTDGFYYACVEKTTSGT
jgi:16S rRNA (cytosine967-C5)-methyltransferase